MEKLIYSRMYQKVHLLTTQEKLLSPTPQTVQSTTLALLAGPIHLGAAPRQVLRAKPLFARRH
jgi:hypothetical protein